MNKAHELNHAKCILKLIYNKFEWSDKNLLNFHRPDINEVFEQLMQDKDRDMRPANPQSNTIVIMNFGGIATKSAEERLLPRPPFYVTLNLRVMTHE